MNENLTVKKSRRLLLLCGALLAGPSAFVLLFHHEDRGLMIVMTALLVSGLFLLGRASAGGSNAVTTADEGRLADDLARLAAVPPPQSFLDRDLSTYNEVFKPRLFGGFRLSSNLWIANGVVRSRSLLRTKSFPLAHARGYAVFRFQFPREVRVMYLCNADADSKFAIDLLAFECHSLVRWAQSNLAEVSVDTLR